MARSEKEFIGLAPPLGKNSRNRWHGSCLAGKNGEICLVSVRLKKTCMVEDIPLGIDDSIGRDRLFKFSYVEQFARIVPLERIKN